MKSVSKKDWTRFGQWMIFNRIIWALPWIYVYIVGEAYPWWVRPLIIFWGGIALIMVVMRAIREGTTNRKKVKADEPLGTPGQAV